MDTTITAQISLEVHIVKTTHHPANGSADTVGFKLAIKSACVSVNLGGEERLGDSSPPHACGLPPMLGNTNAKSQAEACLLIPSSGTSLTVGLPAHLGHIHLDGRMVLGSNDAVARGAE